MLYSVQAPKVYSNMRCNFRIPNLNYTQGLKELQNKSLGQQKGPKKNIPPIPGSARLWAIDGNNFNNKVNFPTDLPELLLLAIGQAQ